MSASAKYAELTQSFNIWMAYIFQDFSFLDKTPYQEVYNSVESILSFIYYEYVDNVFLFNNGITTDLETDK